MTVKNGRRWSTANAYLRPAMERDNLTVVTHALVHKVLLDGRDGKTATGVRYEQGGKVHEAKAAEEVILSAGSIGSPHLLQLSGIGKREVLEKAGIEVKGFDLSPGMIREAKIKVEAEGLPLDTFEVGDLLDPDTIAR